MAPNPNENVGTEDDVDDVKDEAAAAPPKEKVAGAFALGKVAAGTAANAAPGAGESHDTHFPAPALLETRHTEHVQPPDDGPNRPTRSEKSFGFAEAVGCAL